MMESCIEVLTRRSRHTSRWPSCMPRALRTQARGPPLVGPRGPGIAGGQKGSPRGTAPLGKQAKAHGSVSRSI
jgi:hypothetical protein